MLDQILTFRELVAPMAPEVFLRDYYRQRPLHLPGTSEKFSKVFSWQAMNRLLELSPLWTDTSFRMTLAGRLLPPEEYCYKGVDRDNRQAMKPDIRQVKSLLRQGATVSLSFVDGLTPALRSVSQTLEVVLGAEVCGTAFASFDRTIGYASHFDTQNVFALQVAGAKTWRIYEGRTLNAAIVPGAESSEMPQAHHEKAKGQVLLEVTAKPGDLVYIPHGQYHDATAADADSLHISFGTSHLITQDFLKLLMQDLTKDPLFREHLPHFDDAEGTDAQLRRIAQRLQQIILDPQNAQHLRRYVRDKAFARVADFGLPDRRPVPLYRVRWLGRQLERRGASWHLNGAGGNAVTLDAATGRLAEWALKRDYFSADHASRALALGDGDVLTNGLKRMQAVGLIEPL